MTFAVVAGAVVLQVVAGVVRMRGWFHCVRASSEACSRVRFVDVVVAHLGSAGWNGVLPARGGEAVKIALLRRRLPSTPTATLAGTLVPTSLVEAGFTAILTCVVLASGVVSATQVAGRLPAGARAPVLAVVAAAVIVAAVVLVRRVPRLVHEVRAGLTVLGRPRVLLGHVIPWQAAARGLRLVALMAVLTAAGLPLGLGPALLLMALQGATPSVGPASAALRIGVVSAAFAPAQGGVDVATAAEVLITATLATSIISLAVSVIALAIELRTASPRLIVRTVRAACARAGDDPIKQAEASA